jgi:hypothetical protein
MNALGFQCYFLGGIGDRARVKHLRGISDGKY